jgi:hypothetical protein
MFVFLSLFCFGFTIAQVWLRQELFNMSITFIQNWQAKGNESLDVFFNLISALVNPIGIVAFLIVVFCFSKRKLELINFFIYFIMCTFICSLLKNAFGDPRPYWVSDSIQAKDWICY